MLKYTILVLSLLGVSVVHADNDELRKKIEKSLQDVKVSSLKAIDDTGLYEAVINGHRVTPNHPTDPQSVRHSRVAHVPEDRIKRGLVRQFAANETSTRGYHNESQYNSMFFTRSKAIEDHCLQIMENFDVRPPDSHLKSANFSGGNQQKLILAREMDTDPKVLLVGQPTRGVDIGAIEFIHTQIVAMRDRGSAVLVVSGELEELMSLADRIVVMFEGRIVGEVPAAEADEKMLGLMMANAHPAATSQTKEASA